MREIKFRGKRLDNGEWLYGSLVILNGRYFIFDDANRHEVDPTTVGEFTGLKDKNGKIAANHRRKGYRTNPHRGDVTPEQVYKMRIAGFSFNQISLYFRLDWGCVKQRYEDFIHDNPEFLKGGEQ